MDEQRENNWSKWQNLVLDKLDRLEVVEEDVKKIMTNELPHIKTEIGKLQVKAGIWGAIAGALPALIISVIAFLIMLSQFGK